MSTVDVPKLLEALGIKARRRGSEWWAPCPFHTEKKPSWSIADVPGVQVNGSFYCWGCGKAGGPVDLASHVIGNSRGGAVRWMREKGIMTDDAPKPLGITMKVGGRTLRSKFKVPLGLRDGPVEKWVTPARRYVLEERKITAWQIEHWGVLYATDGELGGRIVFPVVDAKDELVNYHARTYIGQEPKYLYPGLHDGADFDVMFGSAYWPEASSRKTATVAVCEGAIDALACERAGVRYIAAFGGAAAWVKVGKEKKVLRSSYVMALASFGHVLLVTDNDDSGDGLAEEVQKTLARWCDVRRVKMPEDEDAASLSQDELTRRLVEARHGNRKVVQKRPGASTSGGSRRTRARKRGAR